MGEIDEIREADEERIRKIGQRMMTGSPLSLISVSAGSMFTMINCQDVRNSDRLPEEHIIGFDLSNETDRFALAIKRAEIMERGGTCNKDVLEIGEHQPVMSQDAFNQASLATLAGAAAVVVSTFTATSLAPVVCFTIGSALTAHFAYDIYTAYRDGPAAPTLE